MKTWHIEGAIVALILVSVAVITHGGWREWLGALAVQLTFHHAAISERMAERQSARDTPDVTCWQWSTRLFVSKELLWFVYFAAVGAWSALVGVVLFLCYPAWRRFWRSVHPIEVRS
jgi:hypothetical protein